MKNSLNLFKHTNERVDVCASICLCQLKVRKSNLIRRLNHRQSVIKRCLLKAKGLVAGYLLVSPDPWSFTLTVPCYFVSSRVVLTVWGAVTVLCGAFIFGQSTTVAVMQILGKIWRLLLTPPHWSRAFMRILVHFTLSCHRLIVDNVCHCISSLSLSWLAYLIYGHPQASQSFGPKS